ncbi:MAG: hypothetical protein HYW03_09630, partial [Deltaproteobacteria bacterium]|nr:hypothetical protein [Deltaproteobacteria bacterium]
VNALLAGVTFTPSLNYNSNFTIATSVDDGVAAPITGTKSMTGIAVNDAPTATNLNAAETYTEDTPLNLTDIVVSDVDSANVTVTLTLSNPGAGSLNTGTAGSVTSTYDAATGLWRVSGAIADVNALLANVTFTPVANYNGDFTIATSVDDGIAAPITGVKSMTGIAVNDAPVLTGNTLTITEGGSVVLSGSELSATDVDNAAASLTFTVSSVAGGQFELVSSPGVAITSFTQAQVGSGAVRFVHDGGAAAPSYDVTVLDGALSDGPAAATIAFNKLGGTVEPIPLPPVPGPITSPPPIVEPPLETVGVPVENPHAPPGETSIGETDNAPSPSTLSDLFNNDIQTPASGPDVLVSPTPSKPVPKPSNENQQATSPRNDAPSLTLNSELEEMVTGKLASGDLSTVIDVSGFVQGLNKLREEVLEETVLEKLVVGSTATVTTGFSIGYVLWLVRGEVLLTSLLASLPAWRLIDPLPVLAFLNKRSDEDEDEDDDSIEGVVKKGGETPQSMPVPKQQGGVRSVKWRIVMQPTDSISEASL